MVKVSGEGLVISKVLTRANSHLKKVVKNVSWPHKKSSTTQVLIVNGHARHDWMQGVMLPRKTKDSICLLHQ